MSQDVLFGELRSLLNKEPDRAVWDELCAQLDQWPDEELEAVAAPYAAGHLDRWDADIARPLPQRWAREALGGSSSAKLRLFNKLTTTPISAVEDTLPLLRALAALRALDQLVELDLGGLTMRDGELDVLCGIKPTALRKLSLHSCGLHGAGALLAAPLMANLTMLELSYNNLGAADVAALRAPAVEWLGLNQSYLRDEGAAALARAVEGGPLRAVGLSSCAISERGAQVIGERLLPRLRVCDLNENELGDAGVEALLSSPQLPTLEHLELSDVNIGERGAAALAAHRGLSNIESLKLSKNERLDDDALRALISGEGLRALYRLDLRRCAISEAGALALAEATTLSGLRSLDLSCGAVGDAGMLALVQSTRLKLNALDLDSPLITDDGLRALAASPQLKRLSWIGLRSSNITAAGAAALAASPHLRATLRQRWREWSPWG